MRMSAVVVTVIGVLGLILGVIARIGSGTIAGHGARVFATGSGLCLLLAIVLLLLEKK